jgi:glycosylphosphatidylinositol transamidase
MLKTMLSMMWTQASGAPSGNHGMFHRFHIEALSLEGVATKKAPRQYDLEQIARSGELCIH